MLGVLIDTWHLYFLQLGALKEVMVFLLYGGNQWGTTNLVRLTQVWELESFGTSLMCCTQHVSARELRISVCWKLNKNGAFGALAYYYEVLEETATLEFHWKAVWRVKPRAL